MLYLSSNCLCVRDVGQNIFKQSATLPVFTEDDPIAAEHQCFTRCRLWAEFPPSKGVFSCVINLARHRVLSSERQNEKTCLCAKFLFRALIIIPRWPVFQVIVHARLCDSVLVYVFIAAARKHFIFQTSLLDTCVCVCLLYISQKLSHSKERHNTTKPLLFSGFLTCLLTTWEALLPQAVPGSNLSSLVSLSFCFNLRFYTCASFLWGGGGGLEWGEGSVPPLLQTATARLQISFLLSVSSLSVQVSVEEERKPYCHISPKCKPDIFPLLTLL